MELQTWHVWWFIDAANIGIELNELDEDPESYLLITMEHDAGHYEIHTLHVADCVIVVSECRKHAT